MKALLLAAGEGTRLRPLTLDRPKPMLPLAGRPVLDHLVALARDHGCDQIGINLHYRPEAIIRHFGDGARFGVRIVYAYESRLLGSAGAVRNFGNFFDETFFVIYGDLFTRADLTALLTRHRASGAAVTVAVHRVDDPWNKGVVAVDAAGMIGRFVEKPRRDAGLGNLVNSGIYVVEPSVIEYIPVAGPCDFGRDLFPRLLAAGVSIAAHELSEELIDIGTLDAYHAVGAHFGH